METHGRAPEQLADDLRGAVVSWMSSQGVQVTLDSDGGARSFHASRIVQSDRPFGLLVVEAPTPCRNAGCFGLPVSTVQTATLRMLELRSVGVTPTGRTRDWDWVILGPDRVGPTLFHFAHSALARVSTRNAQEG